MIERRLGFYQQRLDNEFRIEREREYKRFVREYRTREQECRALLHQLYYHVEDYTKAIEHLDKLLAVDPANSVEYFNRARCHDKLGQPAEALRDYEDFIRLTRLPFNSERVKQAREAVRRLKAQ